MAAELPEVLVGDAAAWERWLAGHHEGSPGAWVVLAKKGVTRPTSLTYDQALEEAACYGWVDGQVSRRDESTYRQRFTPRRPRSTWSATNIALAERLILEGRMRPPGLAAIDRAKADGRWAPMSPVQPARPTTLTAGTLSEDPHFLGKVT